MFNSILRTLYLTFPTASISYKMLLGGFRANIVFPNSKSVSVERSVVSKGSRNGKYCVLSEGSLLLLGEADLFDFLNRLRLQYVEND